MSRRFETNQKAPAPAKINTAAIASRRVAGKGARISGSPLRGPYMPPETWYEPQDDHEGPYHIVEQAPGNGFRHILGEEDIRARLDLLPAWMIKPLQVVQLSQMTRKKRRARDPNEWLADAFGPVIPLCRNAQCESHAVRNTELAKDSGQVSLDCPFCYGQLPSNLLVAFTASDQPHDFAFSLGQKRKFITSRRSGRRMIAKTRAELVQQARHDRAAHP